ncbi:hypothetical protein Tco_0862988 [Tanacetum coccineum]
MTSRRPNILNKSSTQIEILTQEDQIRGYRAMTIGRYQAARATRRLFGRNNSNLTFVDPKRQVELLRERLHALHRRNAGTNTLVVLRDTRWEDSRQIIRTMEVDLFAGTQLFYMFRDMVLSIDDFHNHVEVAIQTHGYDTCQGGESNLMDNVVDHLTTTGITTIPGRRRSVEELEGMSWNLKPAEQTSVHVPSRDYYVKHDAPTTIAQVEEITETGWGDEFSDDENTPGKDPYDQLPFQKQKSESEWENPFAAKHGEHHTILHLLKNDDEDDNNLPYPKFQNFKQLAAKIISKHEEQAFPTSPKSREVSNLHLMQSWDHQSDPGLWSEVISRWESITINRLNNQIWSDNKAKLAFVENLLRESEKLMWKQWQTIYLNAYSTLVTVIDDLQNITSQVRQLILMKDPYRGSTDEQDRDYRDLDMITYEETKNLWSFLEDFRHLELYFPSTTDFFLLNSHLLYLRR